MRSTLFMSGMKMNHRHKKMMSSLIWTSLIVIAVSLVVVYKFFNQPLPAFTAFLVKNNQIKYRTMTPINRPVLTRQSVIEWAELAAVSVNTYNAANYAQELNKALALYFTDEGISAFKDEFINSGALRKVLTAGMTVTAVIQGRPTIIYQGDDLFGTFAWKIQVPMLINYQTLAESQSLNVIVTLLIIKIPTWQSAKGIGVQQYWINSSS